MVVEVFDDGVGGVDVWLLCVGVDVDELGMVFSLLCSLSYVDECE